MLDIPSPGPRPRVREGPGVSDRAGWRSAAVWRARRIAWCIAWLVGAVLPMRAVAQAGAGTDVIVGRITASDGNPLDNAAVAATSLTTGQVRTVTTGVDGRFALVFADGGGRYTLRVRRLGFAPAVVSLERRAEADRIAANVSLVPVAATLQQVTVTARQTAGDSAGFSAGTGRSLSQELVERLPLIDPGDLTAIASLVPGVVATAATDTTAAAISVGGQRPTQNHVTLDGLTFRPASVPRDAIRATKVATSTYDVSKGQFSGGEIESSTKSGTNKTEAALTFDGQDEALQAGAAPTASFSREYSLDRLSGSVAGPIARDRLFAIASFEVSRRTNPIAYLLTADPLTDQRIGIAPDSLRRLLQLVSGYGLPLDPSNVPSDQTKDRGSFLGRLDYLANDANHLAARGLERWQRRRHPHQLAGPRDQRWRGRQPERWCTGIADHTGGGVHQRRASDRANRLSAREWVFRAAARAGVGLIARAGWTRLNH